MLPLRHLTSLEEVENVYLFIADSVRNRATNEVVRSLDVSGRAVAASSYTTSSFSSILVEQKFANICDVGVSQKSYEQIDDAVYDRFKKLGYA